MEIKSIKKILNIGTFSDFQNGASKRYEKVNLIYGMNSYGKTTLIDVLQSLKFNNPELITDRKSIPLNGTQSVELSVKQEDNETSLKYRNNNWDVNTLNTVLEIFSSDFIHKNLFTGLTIQRENKENLTDFILGEQGVIKAEQLEGKRRMLRQKKSEKRNQIPTYVKDENKEGIDNFISINPENIDTAVITSELEKSNSELQQLKQNYSDRNTIILFPPIEIYDIPTFEMLNDYEQLNVLLEQDYSEMKEEVVSQVRNHFEIFKDKGEGEYWVSKGYNLNSKDFASSCPFCGQDITSNELIAAYDLYFNKEFKNYIETLTEDLNAKKNVLRNITLTQHTTLQQILLVAKNYEKYLISGDFKNKIAEFGRLNSELKKQEENINQLNKQNFESILELIQNKIQLPYLKSSSFDISTIKTELSTYINLLEEIKIVINQISESVSTFRQSIQVEETINNKINDYVNSFTTLFPFFRPLPFSL
ncbi:MAG: AAA family ATPase, partial [Bacteroidales bacterium]|nr:AAA family ATPase [Bacteroidales bacterium]